MIEWDVLMRLETDIGVLELNDSTPSTSSGYFRLIYDQCKASRSLRTVVDKIPQGDGEIFHTRFRDGTEFTLAVALWETENDVACGQVRREMYEELVAHLDAMLNGGGRLFWQPSGYGDERMLESARWLTPIEVTWDQGVPVCKFTIDSPLPYVIDKTQPDDPEGNISPGGSSSILVENGVNKTITLPDFSAPFWPVMQVAGPASSFTIENLDVFDEYGTHLTFSYDATRPPADGNIGGGDYVEIDTFREVIYLNGNEDNMKAYVDPEVTDYFYLKPGDNEIRALGADVDFIINYAWCVG